MDELMCSECYMHCRPVYLPVAWLNAGANSDNKQVVEMAIALYTGEIFVIYCPRDKRLHFVKLGG